MPGIYIANLGFPTENLEGENVNTSHPFATMQKGNVMRITDNSDCAMNLLVRHNTGAAGDTSGSPIFTVDGEVVTLLVPGTMFGRKWVHTKRRQIVSERRRDAAVVNFAQRVDLLDIPKHEWRKVQFL